MTRDFPPMPALRVFDAAARHGSFTAASEELGMTQSAVSYQIKILEDRVGAPLFERHARGVALTPIGESFSEQIISAMDIISEAFSEVKGTSQQTLKVNVIPTFATTFLSSAMREFQDRHPGIKVRVEISENTVDLRSIDCDIAIRLGTGDFGGLDCRMLFPAVFTPMMAPELANRLGDLSRPENLLDLPILSPGDPRWQLWMQAAKIETQRFAPDPAQHFGPQLVEAQAAFAGHGVAMLTPAFFQRELSTGALVQPFDLMGEDGNSYWLITGKNRGNSAKIRSFRTWLLRKTMPYRSPQADKG